MPQYSVGDKVILKDDGQVYKIVTVRSEDHVVLYDLEKGDERAFMKITVLPSQLKVQKLYAPKYPRVVIYQKHIC